MRLSDIETAAKIKLALISNPHISAFDIGVLAVNGIIFLSGSVQDRDQRELVEQIVKDHGGIDIKNDLIVLSEQAPVVEESDENMITWDVVPMANPALRDRVISALSNDRRVNAYSINVDAVGSVVRLSGFQTNEIGIQEAEEITRRVQGVANVINELEVQPDEPIERRAA